MRTWRDALCIESFLRQPCGRKYSALRPGLAIGIGSSGNFKLWGSNDDLSGWWNRNAHGPGLCRGIRTQPNMVLCPLTRSNGLRRSARLMIESNGK